jgi:ABC-type transporter Mla MlaB component
MSAELTKNETCVSVRIAGKLGYEVWQTLRDARNAALEANLPLRLDIQGCHRADMGGIGAVMIAQEKLATVEFSGCSERFAECFRAFGICGHCGSKHSTCPF